MFIKWEEKYNVGLQKVDTQHKRILDIINELVSGLKNGKSNENLPNIIERLQKYAREHFDTEEDYFTRFKEIDTKYHLDKHKEFKLKIDEIEKTSTINPEKASDIIVDLLEDWFLDHIVGTDQEYFSELKKKVDPEKL